MKNLTKILSLFLVILTALSLYSCGNSPVPPEEQTTAAATDNPDSSVEDTTGGADTQPVYNLKSDKLRILYWDDVENQEFFADDENGEPINDSIFARNARVEDSLKLELEYFGIKGNWGNYETFVNTVKNSIAGGNTDVYDVIGAYSLTTGVCAYQGLLQKLNDLPYLDLTAEWWPKSLNTTSTIKGKLYFASGDISTNVLYMMYAMFYNKDMVVQLNLTDPFSYVQNGQWTLDRMIEMSKDIYSDDDHDNAPSGGDRFGQACYGLHMDAFLTGSDIKMIETNKNGELELSTTYQSDKTGSLTEKLYKYLHSQDAYIFGDGTYKKVFIAGNSLFITDRADIAVFDLGEKQFEMGILPIPKYDENQKDYCNVVGNPFTLYGIPTNCSDAEAAAAFLECMGHESYVTVTPVIFELAMKSKYSDGGADVISYDILRNGIVYDLGRLFGRVFDQTTDSPGNLYTSQIKNNSTSWTSKIGTSAKLLNKVIKSLNAAFE